MTFYAEAGLAYFNEDFTSANDANLPPRPLGGQAQLADLG